MGPDAVTQTEATLRSYIAAILDRGDFASYFTDDIVGTMMEAVFAGTHASEFAGVPGAGPR
jgi:hypothetical protein